MSYSTSFTRLLSILDTLREKCPWDRKQTIDTLRPLTIEETYELADAIDRQDWDGICEESGDLLLHLVFYAKIGAEKGRFTIDDVIEKVCNKLVARHPHVWGSTQVQNDDDVKRNWEALKLKEGKKRILAGVPPALPALSKATRLGEKARSAGFDWNGAAEVRQKVDEELAELDEAVSAAGPDPIGSNKEDMEGELGDLLFSVINYARFLGLDPEAALERTNRKFMQRFNHVEDRAAAAGQPMPGTPVEVLEQYWQEAKEL